MTKLHTRMAPTKLSHMGIHKIPLNPNY